ncbi:hypothetical protein [Novosphingobium olei]
MFWRDGTGLCLTAKKLG